MNIQSHGFRDLRLFGIVLLFLLLTSNYQAIAQVTCSATAPARVEMGRAFEYTITLNEQPSKMTAVNFTNFKVLNGPRTGTSFSSTFVNGQAQHSQSFSYTYILQPEKEGSFTIPGSEFIVNGNKIKSNNVTITVVQGSQSSQGGQTNQTRQGGQNQTAQSAAPEVSKDDVFVRGSASKTNSYQGEQVIVTYKLYISSAFNGGYQINNINLPTQSGLWSYQLGDQSAGAPKTTETVNNKQYTVFEIRRQAVFPQKTGEITITPMEIDFIGRVIFRTQSGGSLWDQIFGGGGQQAKDYDLNLVSNSIKLHVKPLPEKNKPDNFNELVGNFTIKSELSRSELKANDATNLIITISGSGNIQHVEALNIQFPADFDVTDPKISDNIHPGNSGITGSRSFEYVIIPRSQGNFTIPAATFSFFDLKTGSYKTLFTEEYHLKIEKGEGTGASAETFSNQKDIKVLDRDIRFIKTSDHAYQKIRTPFFASSWYFTLILSPLFLFIIFLIIVRKQIEAKKNIIQTKDRKANKVARKRLKTAHKLLVGNDTEAFYIEISKVLWGYMSDKFHIPLSQLSMESVEERLQKKGLPQESIQEFTHTLQRCEFARFSPEDPEKLKHEMYDLTHSFITKIEKK